MYSEDDLDAAVAAGALSAQAAAGLRAFVARRQASPAVDEENFRLLSGFNDIFVSVATILILVAVGRLAGTVDVAFSGAAVAAASWGLAEYFTRKRRMALPSIVLLLAFVGGVFAAAAALTTPQGWEIAEWGENMAVSAALTAAAAYVHWRRFRVPITVAAGTCAALATALSLVLWLVPAIRDFFLPLLFLGGLTAFAVAMRWDASDRERTTRRSDVAFWLHLSAAPMIVHPVFAMLGMLDSGADAGRATIAVAIYLALGVVALAVDRRALLVSALVYVLYAMSALFRAAGSLGESFALTALIIGTALLLLSALWHRARALVVALLPGSIRERLPVL